MRSSGPVQLTADKLLCMQELIYPQWYGGLSLTQPVEAPLRTPAAVHPTFYMSYVYASRLRSASLDWTWRTASWEMYSRRLALGEETDRCRHTWRWAARLFSYTSHKTLRCCGGPILCPPHEYISASICVGGRPTFISYSSTVSRSKWDVQSRLRPDLSPRTQPLSSELNRENAFPGAAEDTPTEKGRQVVNDDQWNKSATPPSRRIFTALGTYSSFKCRVWTCKEVRTVI